MGRDLILRSRLKFANSRCKKKVSLYLLYNFIKQFERVAQICTPNKFRAIAKFEIDFRKIKTGPKKLKNSSDEKNLDPRILNNFYFSLII